MLQLCLSEFKSEFYFRNISFRTLKVLLLFGDITHSEATYTYVLVFGAMLVFLKCQKEANLAWILYHLLVDELCSNLAQLFDLRIFVILTKAYV